MDVIDVILEAKKGATKKYQLKGKKLVFDNNLPKGMKFPFHYGFIPKTLSGDNDELDIVLLSNKKLATKKVIECVPIGMIKMNDTGEEDNKIIVVTKDNKAYKNIKDVRKAAFSALFEEGALPQNTEPASVDWSAVLKKMTINIIRPKVEQLLSEINDLKTTQERERKRLMSKIDRLTNKAEHLNRIIENMSNTLSWRMTTPLRESEILKVIYSKLRNIK